MTTSEWDIQGRAVPAEAQWSEHPVAVWLFRTVNLVAVCGLLLVVVQAGVVRHLLAAE